MVCIFLSSRDKKIFFYVMWEIDIVTLNTNIILFLFLFFFFDNPKLILLIYNFFMFINFKNENVFSNYLSNIL